MSRPHERGHAAQRRLDERCLDRCPEYAVPLHDARVKGVVMRGGDVDHAAVPYKALDLLLEVARRVRRSNRDGSG